MSKVFKLKSRFINVGIPLACVALLVSACSGGGDGGRPNETFVLASSETLSLALRQTADNSVLPSVIDFAEKTKGLTDEIENFCIDITAENLENVQSTWKALYLSWFRLLPYNFGPLDDSVLFPEYTFIDSLRQRGIDYTATVRDEINDDLLSDDELNTEFFESKTFQNVGLLALEVALFETADEDRSQELSDLTTEFLELPRKCQIITGLSESLDIRVQVLENEWTQDFNGEGSFYDQFIAGAEVNSSESSETLLVSVQGFLDYLTTRNVVTTATPVADIAWEAIQQGITEVATLLDGTSSTDASLIEIMEGNNFISEVSAVRSNIAEINSSILDENETSFDTFVRQLDGNFKREIPEALDVPIRITFSDGD